MKTYTKNKYGITELLSDGQKVMCGYYHEYDREYMKDAYKRTLLERIIDKPFKPVKFGVIVGDAGIHPFWLGIDRKEQYLLVKFEGDFFAKPIPISCIEDAAAYAKQRRSFTAANKDRIGEKGYDKESFDALNKWADEAEKFTQD